MGQRLEFRVATEADVPALVTLIESAYRGIGSRVGWTTEADLLDGQRTDADELHDVLSQPDSLMVAVRLATGSDDVPGEIVACCHLQRRAERTYFGMFAVAPGTQGVGLGSQVIAHAEQFAREEWGSTYLEMTVIRQRVDLIAYYVRRGFVDTGRLLPFPYGDERFGKPLRDDLAFTVLEKQLT